MPFEKIIIYRRYIQYEQYLIQYRVVLLAILIIAQSTSLMNP